MGAGTGELALNVAVGHLSLAQNLVQTLALALVVLLVNALHQLGAKAQRTGCSLAVSYRARLLGTLASCHT